METTPGILSMVYEMKKKCANIDQQLMDELNISQSELLFFSSLDNCQGLSSPELAKNMGLSLSRISRVVDKLVVADKSFLNESGKIDWQKYAPNGGYVLGTKVKNITLEQGATIDRYGNKYGSYVTPVGTSYEQRALPYVENSNAYHKYEVLKPIDNVTKGEIAPAFNQLGGGIQYELPSSIKQLLKDNFLKEIK